MAEADTGGIRRICCRRTLFSVEMVYLCCMISKNRLKWIRDLQQKKLRQSEGVFVAEGPKVVGDLLAAGLECVYGVRTPDCRLDRMATGVWEEVSEDELRRISFLDAPQQVLAVLRQPVWPVEQCMELPASQLVLALDGVQNPGNLGTIVRLADWFGVDDVFCSRDCADVYNPKTVQATMGALSRVRVHYIDIVPWLASLRGQSVPVYGTFLDGADMYASPLSEHGVIVMGNEGRGVSAEVEACVGERLWIPDYPVGRAASESLNVAIATAVVCAEFRRQARPAGRGARPL